ncbi:MAG TPA: oligosaccharide flippase family protein [Acidobacteriaceae bacterium]|nr:oligosaccharide flippase family protein [Acidobacteriaceae bacterium]
MSAIFGKGANLLIGAITVPITVRYLGAEGYGLWMAISSTVSMVIQFDIGIATTLTNLISEAYVRSDKKLAAQYFATALWVILGIVSLLGLVGWLVWPHVNWASLFHVTNPLLVRQAPVAMAVAFIVFLGYLPSGLATRILGGYQELHIANYFGIAGSLLGLLSILAVVYFHLGLPVLVGCFAGSMLASNLACLTWICFVHKPWMKPWPSRFRRAMTRVIFGSGSMFFLIQMANLVVWNSDNIVIAHFRGAAAVTPYSVTWRLVCYITALQTLAVPALWPAYAEAYVRGDIQWVRKTYRRVRWATAALLTVGGAGALFGGQTIIRIWAGPAAVPDIWTLRLMCVWMAVFAFALNQSTLLGATSRVGKQAVMSCIAAAVNLGLSILWVRPWGSVGVLLASILSFVFLILSVQGWEVRRILRGDFLTGGNATTTPNRMAEQEML